jgi:hypothetical protein
MITRLRPQIALILCSLLTLVSGLATGLALGCSGNYCAGSVSSCTPLYDTIQDSCCKDLDGDGMKHCVLCLRDRYLCAAGLRLGPAYSCSNSGAFCS